jgi:hypothetical protein
LSGPGLEVAATTAALQAGAMLCQHQWSTQKIIFSLSATPILVRRQPFTGITAKPMTTHQETFHDDPYYPATV